MADDVLTSDELSRALLARQHLLGRTDAPALDVVQHLVGLQAQNAWSPYLGLFSRVSGFRHEQLGDALEGRTAARIAVMRGTIHLVTAQDAVLLPALTAPLYLRDLRVNAQHAASVRTLDVAAVTAAARALVEESPRVTTALGALLAERWPDVPGTTLSYVARGTLPLVQVPPRGVWGRSGATTWTTAWSWFDVPEPDLSADAYDEALEVLALRYLAAFGPASVADLQSWSGLTGMAAVMSRLGDRVVRLVGAPSPGKVRPRVLYDVPDGPRPPGDTPAPVRFLPDYDNVLLGHADRTRLIADDVRRAALGSPNGVLPGTFLRDGRVGGTWRIERARTRRGGPQRATIVVSSFEPLGREARDDVLAEADAVVRFVADDADEHDTMLA